MSSTNAYSTRRAVFPQDKSSVVNLWRGNLGDPARHATKFEWFYERSPAGEPLTVLLSCADPEAGKEAELIGVAAAGPRALLIGNDVETAGVLVDMTVAAKHRTLFPALVLQKAVLQSGLATFPVLYGFPNPKAAPVFQRVGYRKLGMITRYVRVLRSAQYLGRRLPPWLASIAGVFGDLLLRFRVVGGGWRRRDLEIHWLDLSEARVEPQEAMLPAGAKLIRGVRNATFLRWRFADNGNRRFKFISINRRGQSAQRGWWIAEPVGDVLHICDSSAALMDGKNACDAWAQLATAARRRGFCSMSFACLGPERFIATLLRAGMVPRGGRPVYGAVREDHVDQMQSAVWFLTAADEDE